jgi:hypothetical protein
VFGLALEPGSDRVLGAAALATTTGADAVVYTHASAR